MLQLEYYSRLQLLIQKWLYGLLTKEEYEDLNAWYSNLEGKPLGTPDGLNRDRIEWRLHELVWQNHKLSPPPADFDLDKLMKGKK